MLLHDQVVIMNAAMDLMSLNLECVWRGGGGCMLI